MGASGSSMMLEWLNMFGSFVGKRGSRFIAARDQQLDCDDAYGPAKSKIIKAQGR